jgi:hypothetical protein
MNNVLYKKYKLTTNNKIFELIINLYLLECNYRKLFQITDDGNKAINLSLLTTLINIIKQTKYNFKVFKNTGRPYFRLIVYNKKIFNINELDETFNAKFAKQLGTFYVCASDNFKSHNYQIIIHANGVNTGSPIFVQMCKKNMIIKNMNKILKIFKDIKKLFLILDKNIYIQIKINLFNC